MLSAKPNAEVDNTYQNLDYLGYQKTESNNCFIIHCFEKNNEQTHCHKEPEFILLLEMMCCACNLQIS